MNFLEKLGYGGTATVIGLLIVFAGLTIIIVSLKIMGAVIKFAENRKAAKQAVAEPAPKQAEPVQVPAPVLETVPEEDQNELIAVIAAAIAAFDFGNAQKPVTIKSIKRVSGWKSAARTEQLYKF